MNRTTAIALFMIVAIATPAAADIGGFSSFSVTPVPGPGQIQLNLSLATTGTTTTYTDDYVYMGAALFQPPLTGTPTYLSSAAVSRGGPTTFAHSFSFTVPPATAYKYLGIVAYPSFFATPLFYYYSTTVDSFFSSSLSTLSISGYGEGGFAAARGGLVTSQQFENIPAMTLIGFATLGLLIAAAGAVLLRRA